MFGYTENARFKIVIDFLVLCFFYCLEHNIIKHPDVNFCN